MSELAAPIAPPEPAQSLDGYFGLGGRTVLITGATRGIGRAMADAMAAAGASLVIASDDADECSRQAAEFEQGGNDALGVSVDVRDRDQLRALVDQALGRFGAIDVLICNAGISGAMGRMHEVEESERQQLFAVNFEHALHLTSLVAPMMADHGGGSIILTSSLAGLRGNARLGLYGITKAALVELARNLAVEWGPYGVRANAIAPGLIRTSWASAILSNPEASACRMKATPLRRIGEPWEVAAAALFLAGPGSAFITGQTLVVDGGTLVSDGN
jgi:NAD(P)-dependent dehydrogenase (short-subunit alcohol dehydrogenase family)